MAAWGFDPPQSPAEAALATVTGEYPRHMPLEQSGKAARNMTTREPGDQPVTVVFPRGRGVPNGRSTVSGAAMMRRIGPALRMTAFVE